MSGVRVSESTYLSAAAVVAELESCETGVVPSAPNSVDSTSNYDECRIKSVRARPSVAFEHIRRGRLAFQEESWSRRSRRSKPHPPRWHPSALTSRLTRGSSSWSSSLTGLFCFPGNPFKSSINGKPAEEGGVRRSSDDVGIAVVCNQCRGQHTRQSKK